MRIRPILLRPVLKVCLFCTIIYAVIIIIRDTQDVKNESLHKHSTKMTKISPNS